jgi:hypothetical protein
LTPADQWHPELSDIHLFLLLLLLLLVLLLLLLLSAPTKGGSTDLNNHIIRPNSGTLGCKPLI